MKKRSTLRIMFINAHIYWVDDEDHLTRWMYLSDGTRWMWREGAWAKPTNQEWEEGR